MIHELKFEVKRQTAQPIAQIMSELLQGISAETILCPIPTAPSRIRERGFDHTKLITTHLSEYSGLEQKQFLGRKTNARQVGSSRSDRFKHMEQEFYTKNAEQLKGRNVLLVDDVFTTGATLSGASRVLKSAGAKSVSAIVFAQKV
jgi:ComF family protein